MLLIAILFCIFTIYFDLNLNLNASLKIASLNVYCGITISVYVVKLYKNNVHYTNFFRNLNGRCNYSSKTTRSASAHVNYMHR